MAWHWSAGALQSPTVTSAHGMARRKLARTTQIAHQRGMAHKHKQDCSRRREMTHTHTHTHTHTQECSRKGANHPDSTPERNGTQTHTGLLSEKRNDTHTEGNGTHTYRNALGRAQTTQIAHQRGMAHTHTRRNALGEEHDQQRRESHILHTSATWAA